MRPMRAAVINIRHDREQACSRTPLHRPRAHLANFWQSTHTRFMGTMNISLPDTLKAFVDEQVSQRGYGTSSEYVRELIRKDQDRLQLRSLLISGAESPPAAVADGNYFEGLRDKVRKAAGTTPKA